MTDAHSRITPNVSPPYLSVNKIRRTCLEALASVDLLPTQTEPIRIDRFIEKKFNIEPQYEDLPNDVLGYTKFADGMATAVIVNRALDCFDRTVNARRLRTTFAHEAGHCLLHACLFGRNRYEPGLFAEEVSTSETPFLCRHENHRSSDRPGRAQSTFDRLEYQANQAIGALLLPKPLVEMALEPFTKSNELGMTMVDKSRFEDAARMLSRVFDVNPMVAKIWLNDNPRICS